MRKHFALKNQNDKPLSKTQQKKQMKILYEAIRKSEDSKPPIHYTCCICNQNLLGGYNLIRHFEKHDEIEWYWKSSSYITHQSKPNLLVSSDSRGRMCVSQMSGEVVD